MTNPVGNNKSGQVQESGRVQLQLSEFLLQQKFQS